MNQQLPGRAYKRKWSATAIHRRRIRRLLGGRATGCLMDEALLPHLSPLGWEHIHQTGASDWRLRLAHQPRRRQRAVLAAAHPQPSDFPALAR